MKKEIEKSEYDRLKSREEKLMAYYEWFGDKENDLATVEDIVNKNIELEEENKKLKEYNGELIENHKKDIDILCEENKKLNIKVASLEGEIKGLNYTIEKLREELSAYDREYFDEDKKASEIYKEQYQHSMGFSDFGGYDD